jgi:DNA-binding protein HU-beta
MAKSMTKSEIINHLATKTKTTKKVAAQFLDEFVKLSYKEAKKDFVVPGLGKLKVSNRAGQKPCYW